MNAAMNGGMANYNQQQRGGGMNGGMANHNQQQGGGGMNGMANHNHQGGGGMQGWQHFREAVAYQMPTTGGRGNGGKELYITVQKT